MNSIEILNQSIGSFLGFIVALVIFYLGRLYLLRDQKKTFKNLQHNLLLMIVDEVNFNISKMKQIVNEDKKGIRPYYNLKTRNKDTVWSKIIEYRHKDSGLIKEISRAYYEYELINRTFDILFFHQELDAPIFRDSTIPLCKNEIEHSNRLLELLKEKLEIST